MSEHEKTREEAAMEYQPSQITGQLKAIGAVLPEAANASGWAEAGEELQHSGHSEVLDAKRRQAAEAVVDSATAKVKSGFGYITGDQSMQSRGNTEAESAQWKYKQGTSDSTLAVPVPSVEGVKGKVESVVGMVTGDQGKQMEGNQRAEKAAWKDGV
ncbi:uncharacterized protein MKK02DRAFT_40183 [Dioszegia hungarica]|uniref:CsbD-like domain-containing protein n=1 Tax=Dioszegia hungarica TaxID=4972 RepID=A0AA38LZA1_9TREE|nr:uncharacterized protein MKK02DRAFT_40183 [Dioszegia hungarica]KAI9639854.1 hypothetical protein MKK02DRAFT_40183 [Dioszegia hungarica]